MLTEAQRQLVELTKKYEVLKVEYTAMSDAIAIASQNVATEIGVDTMFQDDDGTVFRVVEPKGTFVAFKKYAYQRTRRMPGEKATISSKEAQEAGFVL